MHDHKSQLALRNERQHVGVAVRSIIKRAAKLNFDADLRRIVLETLPHDTKAHGEKLQSFSTSKLLTLYYNWRSRYVTPAPRKVVRSAEFKANPKVEQFQPHIRLLLAKIAAGVDLSPHLSNQTKIGYEEHKEQFGKRAIDLLLNDWLVHHLHFKIDQKEPNHSKKSRIDEIIFIIFRAKTAFVLDVFTHRDWTHERVVEIAVSNWPEKELFWELRGVSGMERTVTSDDRTLLRKNRVNSMIELGGKVYAGRGGFSTAGTPIEATIKSDRLLRLLDIYSRDESLLLEDTWKNPDNWALKPPPKPSFEVVAAWSDNGYGFALRERTTGATLWVG